MLKIQRSLTVIVWILLFAAHANQPGNAQEHYQQVLELNFQNVVSDVGWSSDGNQLAIVEFPSIYILDTTTWEVILTIPHADVSHVVWNSNGTRIASVAGGNPSSVFIRDSSTGELVTHQTIFYEPFADSADVVLPMYELAWSPDDRYIASDSYATNVLLWDIDSEQVHVLGSHQSGRVGEVDWSPQSAQVASAGYDGSIRIWDAASGENLISVEGYGSVDWHPTEDKILGALCARMTTTTLPKSLE